MTIIANSIKTVLATFGLVCAIILGLFFASAYTGGEEIAKVGCAFQTDGVAEYSTCMYNAGASIDN